MPIKEYYNLKAMLALTKEEKALFDKPKVLKEKPQAKITKPKYLTIRKFEIKYDLSPRSLHNAIYRYSELRDLTVRNGFDQIVIPDEMKFLEVLWDKLKLERLLQEWPTLS